MFSFIGRTLQLIGLLLMPSAIWIGEFHHSEAGAISVFAGSAAIFFAGYLLSKANPK